MPIIIVGLGSKCLDIKGDAKINGAPIILNSRNGGLSQQWELNANRNLVSQLATGKCLGIEGSKGNNNDCIILSDIADGINQKWSLSADGTLTSDLNKNKCIDVDHGINEDGRPVILHDKNRAVSQAWSFVGVSAVPFVDGILITSLPDPTVYIIENGQRRGFSNQEAFLNAGYKLDAIQFISQALLTSIPLGSPFQHLSAHIKMAQNIPLPFPPIIITPIKAVPVDTVLLGITGLTLKTDLFIKPVNLQTPELLDVARQTIGVIRLLPTSLLLTPDNAVKNQQAFLKSASQTDVNASVLSLYMGTQALIAGGSNNQNDIDSLLQAAFGQDKYSAGIRDQLTKPFGASVTIPDSLKDIVQQFQTLISAGLVRQWIIDASRCAGVSGIPVFWRGSVVNVTIDKPCAGGKIVIEVKDAGATTNLQLSLPTISPDGKIVPFDISVGGTDIVKDINKVGNTTLTLSLPENITSGDLYFYIQSGSACKSFWSGVGPQKSPPIHITAGRPTINFFTSLQTGPVYPRQFIDLKWDVVNADNISIEMVQVPTSPAANELPVLQIPPKQLSGQLHVIVNCTRRWQGQYILHASNSCGMTNSLPISFDSDWSEFLIGGGMADVTDTTPGLGMQGFADDLQKTVDVDVDTRLFSRAFIIAKNKMNPTPLDYTALVTVDIWSCVQAIKTEVVNRLNSPVLSELNKLYTVENVLISGTHTHSGPGGYSNYFLYNLNAGGFDQANFNQIVTGIVNSIVDAHRNLAPGRIYINKGEVNNCGVNRSMDAYRANHNVDLVNTTDKVMTLLKFVKYNDGHGNQYEIGLLNWYAIHPTSLGQSNTTISGDNKGWASHLFESDRKTSYPLAPKPFIAAFANSCAGDVSGNIDSNGIPFVHNYIQDRVRMKDLGNIQYLKAKEIFLPLGEEITGDISFRYTHIQMSNIAIDNQPGARTWPAALGVSFGAGSTEDGKASTFVKEVGMNIPSPINEGVTNGNLAFTDIAAIAAAIALLPPAGILLTSLATAVLTGVGISAASQAFITFIQVLPPILASSALNALPYLLPTPVVSAIGFGGLQDYLNHHPLPNSAPWNMPQLEPLNPSPSAINGSVFIAGQAPKPIMFPVGNCSPVPLVPNKVPIQIIKIGQLILGGVPGEITTEAGRRLKSTLQSKFVNPLNKIVLATYANAYSGYITTIEEYSQQHYEGASTLYGPHTLEAYQQEFSKLATATINKRPPNIGNPEEVDFVRLGNRGIPNNTIDMNNKSEKPMNMIYVNNRSSLPVIIRVFYVSKPDNLVSYNFPHESVPANENLLINVPIEPFVVSVNNKQPVPQKGGDIILIPASMFTKVPS